MPEKFVSYWDEEQRKLLRDGKINEYRRILKAENLPRLIQGGILKVKNILPTDLLIKAGYRERDNGGFTKVIDSTYRYHAYILDIFRIEIHTDKVKFKDGKWFHIASTYLVKEEKKRLRKFIPLIGADEAVKRKRYKTEVLPRDKMLEALAKIKAENEAIQAGISSQS